MTQNDKELLLKDLCARLPYGVVVKDRNGVHTLTPGNTEFIDLFNGKCNIAPYLFPLSSMSEEKIEDLLDIVIPTNNGSGIIEESNIGKYMDWCYKNHLDINGLLPKGLALDATNKNIY